MGVVVSGMDSSLTRGNFWQVVIIGGFVVELNHTLHSENMEPDNGYDKNGKQIINNGEDTTGCKYDEKQNVPLTILLEINT